MNVGRLNKRIEIWYYQNVFNELCEVDKQEALKCTVWAEIVDTKGLKQSKDVVDDIRYDYKLRIRYTKNIDETMTVKYQGRVFKINAIIDVNFAHVEMFLLCEEVK